MPSNPIIPGNPIETKFYVDAQGNYLGGYYGAQPPDDALEIEAPPKYAWNIWNGKTFDDGTAPEVELRAIDLANMLVSKNVITVQDVAVIHRSIPIITPLEDSPLISPPIMDQPTMDVS